MRRAKPNAALASSNNKMDGSCGNVGSDSHSKNGTILHVYVQTDMERYKQNA